MSSQKNITDTRNQLMAPIIERWPTLFDAKNPIPLAIGIAEELLNAIPNITIKQIKQILGYWCNRPRYLKTIITHDERYGLDGAKSTISEEAKIHALERLKKIAAKNQEKKQHKAKSKKTIQTTIIKNMQEKAEKIETPQPAKIELTPTQLTKPTVTIKVKKRRSVIIPSKT